ncbi:MAG: NPCBM/NEW2 domain-containing protein, partial [Cetobacterium sp.]
MAISQNNIKTEEGSILKINKYLSDSSRTFVYLSDLNLKNDSIYKDTTIAKNKPTLRLENGEVVAFDKAISVLSNSKVNVKLEGKNYKRFQSYVGMDRE